jgi:hypothetical protein
MGDREQLGTTGRSAQERKPSSGAACGVFTPVNSSGVIHRRARCFASVLGGHVSPSRELRGNLGLPQSNLNLKATSKGKIHSGPFALERGASSAGSTRMSRVPIEHTRRDFFFSSQPVC